MKLRTLATLLSTTALTSIFAVSQSVWANIPHPPMANYGDYSASPKPSWSHSVSDLPGNQSFLVRTQNGRAENLSTDIFRDEKSNREIRVQVEREYDSYEAKRNAGLAESTDEKTYFQRMKDITRSAVNGLSKLHAKATGRHLRNYAETDLSAVRTPLAGAVLAAALYRGKAFGFNLAEDVRVVSHTALKNKESSLSMVVPGFTSSVYYTQADNLSARVSKQIVDNISAEVSTADKGTAQLKYGISF